MADPLSVAAGVAGLVTVAAQVSKALYIIIDKSATAPHSARLALSEVQSFQTSILAAQSLFDNIAVQPRSRTSIVKLEPIRATLADALLVFTELQKDVAKVQPDFESSSPGLAARYKWARMEDRIQRHIQSVAKHQNCLVLFLNVMQWQVRAASSYLERTNQPSSESQVEAQRSVQQLEDRVSEILVVNADLRNRLQSIAPSRTAPTTIVKPVQDDAQSSCSGSPIHTISENAGSHSDGDTIRGDGQGRDSSHDELPIRWAFESDLSTSRVYRRVYKDECDASFSTSVVRTHAWSILAGLSLSDISDISVIALPLLQADFADCQWNRSTPNRRGVITLKLDWVLTVDLNKSIYSVSQLKQMVLGRLKPLPTVRDSIWLLHRSRFLEDYNHEVVITHFFQGSDEDSPPVRAYVAREDVHIMNDYNGTVVTVLTLMGECCNEFKHAFSKYNWQRYERVRLQYWNPGTKEMQYWFDETLYGRSRRTIFGFDD